MVAKKRKRIALIGFPIAPLRVIPIYSAIAQHHSRNKVDWEVVASVEGNVESMEFLKFIKCDGAFVRLLNDEMASVARTIDFPVVNISSLFSKVVKRIDGCLPICFAQQAGAREAHDQHPPANRTLTWYIKIVRSLQLRVIEELIGLTHTIRNAIKRAVKSPDSVKKKSRSTMH